MKTTIGIIILAAGGSRRLGMPKQLLQLEGRTLLRRAAEAALACQCGPVAIVLGAAFTAVSAELQNLPVAIAENAHWSEGLAGSIQTGLAKLLEIEPALDAVILAPCDQIHLTAGVLTLLVQVHRQSGRPMVASAYAGTIGTPALFAASEFAALRALSGDQGARRLLARASPQVATVPFPGGEQDIDTLADWHRLAASAPASTPARESAL